MDGLNGETLIAGNPLYTFCCKQTEYLRGTPYNKTNPPEQHLNKYLPDGDRYIKLKKNNFLGLTKEQLQVGTYKLLAM